ncbi:formyltetrahydrofolate-dependent phosphoribosylglycinamide formyltransferase [Natronincola peptidivorans]|uniref:Phosphoribosylglycinamide formyltransferase n=1 Tax=Natronincola peptidivorans TaxID=426128 RepID=A0A1I0A2S1_9FIRM|nr:phosphoribosylglycinamide formyltransferase [Natronincola peptidivorans]SES87950.1 formyltetrahydrofolate-dependent phosphoribosylglycinamide formyltransferase [Natronincola peptidivorans]
MSGVRIAVLISGGGTNLQALIDAVETRDIKGKIALVISNKRDAYGLVRAEKHGIETMVLEKETYGFRERRDAALLEILQEKKIDLIVLAGYLAILPSIIINAFPNRVMNIHPSLIPSFCGNGYYGEKVHEEALKRGIKVTGATVHFVNEVTDGGPIILQETVEVDFEDDVKSLQEKVLEAEHKILPLAVKLFAEEKLEVVGNRVKIEEVKK